MFCLNIRYTQSRIANLDKILFTLGKLRNYVCLTAAQHLIEVSKATTAVTIHSINKSNTTARRQKMSHCSENTLTPLFKEFRMMDYDIIGFDLDGTLLRYELNNMVVLEYNLLKDFLVKERNYPGELLETKFESDFLQKGLIIDTKRGNILKLNENGTILKAAHGTSFMNDHEICQVYGDLRKWHVAQDYIKDPLSAWNGPIAEKLRTLLDYFDIGASLVFAQAVDVVDKTSSKSTLAKNDYAIWADILSGLIKIYSREHFAGGESGYFETLKANPEKYLLKTDDKVLDLLKQLRASGKALFLLTGSNIDFANFTASYALGPKWYRLFDYVIGFAKKPGFFDSQRQFLKIDNLNEVEGSDISLKEDLIPNMSYSQGNWQQLKTSLCKYILHKNPEHVRSLYVGDNLIQDIYAPNAVASIDTLALSEELLENDNNYDFKSIIHSNLWGSYFSNDGIPTLWSKIIETRSKLCVSHINVLSQIPIKEKIYCENKEGIFS